MSLAVPQSPAEDEAFDELAERLAARLAPRLAEALDTRPLLKVEEVAERLVCSKSKVNTLIRDGAIAVVRIGEQRRVEQRELDRYIAACRGGGDG